MKNERVDSFTNRLNEAIRVREIRPVELAKKTGYNKANISQWLNGVYEAKQEGVFKLAQALDVAEAWLMGYDVPMEKDTFQKLAEEFDKTFDTDKLAYEVRLIEQIQKEYGREAVHLLEAFTKLNPAGRKKALENISDLAELPKYTEEKRQELLNA